MSAPIQIVDENDQPLRSAMRQEAWEQGLIHRMVRVMVENKRGEVLLQQRGANRATYPGCWNITAGGHVDVGEDYEESAYRELEEEIGITDQRLIEVGQYRSDETIAGQRFNRVYKLVLDAENVTLRLQSEEVADAKWFTKAEMKRLITEHPDQVTDALRQVVERYY